MSNLHETLHCLGHYGFAIGYARATGGPGEYCNECPLRAECWTAHRALVAKIFPDLTAEFEKMAREHHEAGKKDIKELFERWRAATTLQADPYSIVMAGNVEDGLNVGLGGRPKDRGDFTLPWPLAAH